MRLIRVTNLYAVITAVWAMGAQHRRHDLGVRSAPRLTARTLRAAIVAAFVFRLSDIDNHTFEPRNLLVLGIEEMNDTLTICIFLDTIKRTLPSFANSVSESAAIVGSNLVGIERFIHAIPDIANECFPIHPQSSHCGMCFQGLETLSEYLPKVGRYSLGATNTY